MKERDEVSGIVAGMVVAAIIAVVMMLAGELKEAPKMVDLRIIGAAAR